MKNNEAILKKSNKLFFWYKIGYKYSNFTHVSMTSIKYPTL